MWRKHSVWPSSSFLVMGMQKCGTGALKEFLRRNPFLGYSRYGESHFFDRNPNYDQGYEYYLSLQPEVQKEVLVFDKTPRNDLKLYDKLYP